jgi:hypothetical protein
MILPPRKNSEYKLDISEGMRSFPIKRQTLGVRSKLPHPTPIPPFTMKTRRTFLTLGLLAGAGSALPRWAAGPDWLAALRDRLLALAVWVRTERAPDGAVEAHCGVADPRAWAGCAEHLAGRGIPVRAAGNTLSFSANGHPVRIILHPPSARI